MKLRTWKFWLSLAICFTSLGIIRLIEKKYFRGIGFISLGGLYFVLSITRYKGTNKSNESTLSDTDLENMDNELRNLIAEGKKIVAIKKYRMITGLGLNEAKEYVDLLSESTLK